jgi:hypothetical protein
LGVAASFCENTNDVEKGCIHFNNSLELGRGEGNKQNQGPPDIASSEKDVVKLGGISVEDKASLLTELPPDGGKK